MRVDIPVGPQLLVGTSLLCCRWRGLYWRLCHRGVWWLGYGWHWCFASLWMTTRLHAKPCRRPSLGLWRHEEMLNLRKWPLARCKIAPPACISGVNHITCVGTPGSKCTGLAIGRLRVWFPVGGVVIFFLSRVNFCEWGTHGQKVTGSIRPARAAAEFYSPEQASVLVLIKCPFHPRVTAVTRKRPRSFS